VILVAGFLLRGVPLEVVPEALVLHVTGKHEHDSTREVSMFIEMSTQTATLNKTIERS
jgi:hypothetical protein